MSVVSAVSVRSHSSSRLRGAGAAQPQAAGNAGRVFHSHVAGMSAFENTHVVPQALNVGFESCDIGFEFP